jgi:probable HAF family extracellular repeat protein
MQLTAAGYQNVLANGVNNKGQVVGEMWGDSGDTAFLWSNGSITNVGILPGYRWSEAVAINNNSQIVGTSHQSSSPPDQAFLYSAGQMTGLGNVGCWGTCGPGTGSSFARGINDSGQIVGTVDSDAQSFLFSNGGMSAFKLSSGTVYTAAEAINNAGQIVGDLVDQGANPQVASAFLYSGGTTTTLPSTSAGVAWAVNTQGQAVGCTWFRSPTLAFIYSNGTVTSLGTLPGDSQSCAYGINDAGQVVGWSQSASGNTRAFLYSNGTMYDLNVLAGLPAGTLRQATGINNSGQIIANTAGLSYSTSSAYLLTPPAGQPFLCPAAPSAATTSGQVDFGGQLGLRASTAVTCTYPIKVPKGSPFVLLGVKETDTYWTDADAAICGALSCSPNPSFNLTVTGPAGQPLPLTVQDSTPINAPPSGAGWTASQSSVVPCFSTTGCPNGSIDFHSMGFPDLGTHHLAQAVKDSGTILLDTSALTLNGDAIINLTYTLNALNSWEPLDVQVAYSADNWFTLARDSATAYQFHPRDSREPESAQCTTFPEDCFPKFRVYWNAPVSFFGNSPAYQPLPIKADFTLALPAGATAWLQGTSTNSGSDPTTTPDYIFDQAQNPGFSAVQSGGLAITRSGVTTAAGSIPVVISSQDYGGSANLNVTITITSNGTNYPFANIPVADPKLPLNTQARGTWNPPSCAGTGMFQPLPLDTDCNGIADWWEGQYTTPAGGHLDRNDDREAGYDGVARGDGYSVHDEYRGFHYMLDNGTTVRWTSTDPVGKFDVFFWDPTNHYTARLRDILAQQGTDADRQSGNLRFLYRRVDWRQGNARNRRRPDQGCQRLNRNSQTTTAQQAMGFAVVYAEQVLNANNNTGGKSTLGKTPSIHNDGSALYIDPAAINRFLQQNNGFPANTMTAQVVAHETGHHFGRLHPQRPGCTDVGPCAFIPLLDTTGLPNLTMTQFAFVGVNPDNQNRIRSNVLYLRLTSYLFNGQPKDADDLLSQSITTVDNATGKKTETPGLIVVTKTVQIADPNTPVMRVTLRDRIDSTASLFVQNQLQRLMDWTPYLNFTQPVDWRFSDNDMQALCVRKACN